MLNMLLQSEIYEIQLKLLSQVYLLIDENTEGHAKHSI